MKKLKHQSLSCYYCDDFSENCNLLCHQAFRCYTSITRDSEGLIRKSKGCTSNKAQSQFYCGLSSFDGSKAQSLYEKSAQYAFQCCDESYCNNQTYWPTLPPIPKEVTELSTSFSDSSSISLFQILFAVSLPFFLLLLFVTLFLILLKHRHLKRMKKLNTLSNLEGPLETEALEGYSLLRATAAGDSTLREVFKEGSLSSGSGSGHPFLVQRTLAKQIHLVGDSIGKGRYGQVWKGLWNGDLVAVKIFFSRDEESWKRETDIYSTLLLRHENILGYIASDCTSYHSCTQLWLVTHYHPLGSLYDVLNRSTSSLFESLRMIVSALNGLIHLHTEIFGTQGKPGIAHRDIKSKNILVKEDGVCLLADFGLAVTHCSINDALYVPENIRVGTKRYMSPELLNDSLEKRNFESYRRIDVYAFSLVLWEILRRTRSSSNNVADDYALPFIKDVPSDPSFEDMRKVVCEAKKRPEISSRWTSDPIMNALTKIMNECWHDNPTVRLPVLRIKKSIKNIIRKDPKLSLLLNESL